MNDVVVKSSDGPLSVTLPAHLEVGAEVVIRNESKHPITVVAPGSSTYYLPPLASEIFVARRLTLLQRFLRWLG
jgi:hypothetical protein